MPRHRERGPKQYQYTVETIAAAAGLVVSTVHQHTSPSMIRGGSGVDPSDIQRVASYIQRYKAARSRPLAPDEFLERIWAMCPADPALARLRWEARWPAFQPFGCAERGCLSVVFEIGFCGGHGGSTRPAMAMDHSGYFQMLTETGYRPFHRLIAGEPPGLDVHHLDDNKWNNRPANLRAMTHKEHFGLHRSAAVDS